MADSHKVPLRVGLKPEDGEIIDVGPCRHRVIWAGDVEPSPITYCNNCGSGVVVGHEGGPAFCACGAPAE